jgi:hypothetical protein
MITFRDDVPLSDTMAFELLYHPNLQMDLASKKFLFDIPGAIFTWMFVDDVLAGETYGVPLATAGENLPGLAKLAPAEKQAAIYCYSNTLLPPFHHRGLGAVMKSHWLTLVATAGFTTVYGHARPGPSQRLNASFGAEFLQTFPNWYRTGEDYKLYRLALPANP